MALKICFTYNVVTNESAENGDYAEHGWITPGHWKYALEDEAGYHDDTLEEARKGEYDLHDLREALSFAESLGISAKYDLTSADPDIDYSDGSETQYAMHIEGVTPSTYKRILSLMN